jgi:predicted phage terminase large subunit-like protein
VLYRGFVGGRGVGKTWIGAYDLLRRCQPARTYLVVSPTYVLLEDTSLATFLELARRFGVYRGHKTTPRPSVKIACGKGRPRATVRFRSSEEPDKLRGPNLSGVWLDEASLMPHEAYTISIAALREKGQQGWLSATFTPRGTLHWTYEVFGKGQPNTAIFHAATRDNPFLPKDFATTLREHYDSFQGQQELEGLFVDPSAGKVFNRAWFAIVPVAPAGGDECRFWDLASREAKLKATKTVDDPDFTAGVKIRKVAGVYYVTDCLAFREAPAVALRLIDNTCRQDAVQATQEGSRYSVGWEIEPGAASRYNSLQLYRLLDGLTCKGIDAQGDKVSRALPLSAQAEVGNVKLVAGAWNEAFLRELHSFPDGAHDDMVDASSGAYARLTQARRLVIG